MMKTTMRSRITATGLAAFACVLPVLAEQAPSGDAIMVNDAAETCEMVLPAGTSFRLERLTSSSLSLRIRGDSPSSDFVSGSSRCVLGVEVSPLPGDAGVQVDVQFLPDGFRSLEQSGGWLRLSFSAQGTAADAEGRSPVSGYRVGPGDELTLGVPSHPDLQLTRDIKVDQAGRLSFEYLGSVEVAGLTPIEIAEKLKRLLDESYLVNPEVSVTVKTYGSQSVFVSGEVNKPGKVFLRGGTTLQDALAEAGGFSPLAGAEVTISRRKGGGAEVETIRLSRKEIERERADIPLQPGDEVSVAEKKYFYVHGEVQQPDKYEYVAGVTLLQSISMAHGTRDWANKKSVRLLRTVGGTLERKDYDLRAIEKGKAPDVPLEPGDIIHVPRRLL